MNKETFEKATELTTLISLIKADLVNLASLDDVNYACPMMIIDAVYVDGEHVKVALILQRDDIVQKLKVAEAELAEL